MVNGLYTATRGMMNILAKQDIHTQNLANTSTTGFKLARLVNRTEVTIDRNDEGKLHQKELQSESEVFTSFAQGPMVKTGNNMDLAIAGTGFFSVETPEGTRYTRGGSFSTNSDSELVTLSGNRVLDEGGAPIVLKGENIQFMQDGGIFVDGKKEAALGVMDFPDTRKLKLLGNGLIENGDPKNNAPTKSQTLGISQGFLEGSNVDPVSTMVNIISDFRTYESDQKAVKAIDETLGRAVNEVGKV